MFQPIHEYFVVVQDRPFGAGQEFEIAYGKEGANIDGTQGFRAIFLKPIRPIFGESSFPL